MINDLTTQELTVYKTYKTFMAAQKSGEGRAIDYQGKKLGAQMRAYYMDMAMLEDVVALAEATV